VRPEDVYALYWTWTLYRLQLSAAETAAALWWAAMRELWLPHTVARRRPGPSLAEMVRETRQDKRSLVGNSAAERRHEARTASALCVLEEGGR
jgi:hypothetical protein